jgi:hypothetical protein
MCAVAKGRRLGLFALTKPNDLGFVEYDFNTFKGSSFYIPVGVIAPGFNFRQAATAPFVDFSCLYFYLSRFAGRHPWQAFIGDQFHKVYLLAMN